MSRAILVLTVIVTAVVIGTSAVAYARQSDDKKTLPETNTSSQAIAAPENTTTSESTQPISIENHAWNNYHWAPTAIPFTLELGDNVTEDWDSYLDTTISDWNISSVLDTTKIAGEAGLENCPAKPGQVQVCNAKYGKNGWLGIATIWISGDHNHITQGTTKLNDTYFDTKSYNKPAWRNLVMCQEVGHTFGLGHQDERFNNRNLDTCMDYTNKPGSNQHPNQHDYDQLESIYRLHLLHLDEDESPTTGEPSTGDENEPGDDPRAWGRETARSSDGRESIYEKNLGKGKKKVTHVLWTLEKAAQHRRGHNEDHEHQE
jgi:hypothetical protein